MHFLSFLFVLFINQDALAFTQIENLSINSTDTLFMFINIILMFITIIGLSLFYSGLVLNKNLIFTMSHSLARITIILPIWVICAYSLAFSENTINGYFGDLKYLLLNNIGSSSILSNNIKIPTYLFILYHGMLAVLASIIVTGSFSEKLKLIPSLVFSILWVIFVYSPIAHWIWGGGWINKSLAPMDFAGGIVVHVSASISGIITLLMIKNSSIDHPTKPSHIPLNILGAGFLWLGWFGINAGAMLSVNSSLSLVMMNTILSSASGLIAWTTISYFYERKIYVLKIMNGALAGLIAISPSAVYIEPQYAIIVGFCASSICYLSAAILKPKLGKNIISDILIIHAISGCWGSIATGIFSNNLINPNGYNGLIYGRIDVFINQILSCFIIIAYSTIATFIIISLMNLITKVQASTFEGKKWLAEFDDNANNRIY